MFALSSFAARHGMSPAALKRVAQGVVAGPAAVITYLFVVNPEALGSPLAKLALMALAGCLLMLVGELSEALARHALAWQEQLRASQVGLPAPSEVADAHYLRASDAGAGRARSIELQLQRLVRGFLRC